VTIYFDASVILTLFLEEPDTPSVDRFIKRNRRPLAVSEFAAAEVASGLSLRIRSGTLTETEARETLRLFDNWRATEAEYIHVRTSDFKEGSDIVRRFDLGLRAPDAIHLAVCRGSGLALATRDRRLAEAATTLGVEVVGL